MKLLNLIMQNLKESLTEGSKYLTTTQIKTAQVFNKLIEVNATFMI